MAQRETVPPTIDEHGDEVHPAFAMAQVHRISSTPGAVLFDSDIKHGEIIRLTVTRATRARSLHRDWIHSGTKTVVEVDMSMAQWAGLVSSMGTSGVPVTIRATEGDWSVPGLPYDPRLAHSVAEVKEGAHKTFDAIKEALAEYEAVIAAKGGAKERRAALSKLHHTVQNTAGNLAFAAESLSEHTENVVQKARADLEAMVINKAAQLGLSAGDTATVLELPVLPGERKAVEQ